LRAGYRQFCAIARTLDLVGQRWTLLVVRELLLRGPLSVSGIARGLPDVPMNQLAERLAMLEARGVVRAGPGPGGEAAQGEAGKSPARVYEATEPGRELAGVLEALARYGLGRLVEGGAQPDDAILPHVLMRQLELRYDGRAAAEGDFAGCFELVLLDPQTLWSVEPGAEAPARWALVARDGELRIRAGACLDPDAVLELSVDACSRLVAGATEAELEIEVSGDRALAGELLRLVGAKAPAGAAAAA
jgi:DNA-binding HxlR family transcriptional regulator